MLALVLVASAQAVPMDAVVDRLSADVAHHTAGVRSVEQKLLPLTDTRVLVSLSLGDRQALDLDSLELFIDNQRVVSHRYSDKERASLRQGSEKQLYVGNLSAGTHQLKMVINARAENNRFVRREISHRFRKQAGMLRLKMALDAKAPQFEPEVLFTTGIAELPLPSEHLNVAVDRTGALASDSKGYRYASALLASGERAEAKAAFIRVFEGDTRRGEAALELAKLALAERDLKSTEHWYREAQRVGYGETRQQAILGLAELERVRGRADSAGRYLAAMDEGYWAALGYMNLASDFSREDLNPSRALVSLRVAMAMAAKDTDESRSKNLLDQLHLRAGYLALKNKENEKAVDLLEKVRLDSYYAPQALYFHGLALANKGNHRAAMQSWHRAKKFPLAFPGVADAWIGMGRGYDLAGYPGQAGESWLAANAAYQGERVTLNALASRIREEGAYKALVKDARGPDAEWFLADSRTLTQPRMAYLFHFLEQSSAQVAVRRVARLDDMSATLAGNDHDLAVFIKALRDLQENQTLTGKTAKRVDDMASQARALKEQIHQLQVRVDKSRAQAADALDALALAFVDNQYQRMGNALDKTEQQIAHLYEYLALEKLGEGEQ
ncbi:tol-pal system YbgF family protein [Marinobacter sp.]|uniref:tetratricopeptide repeat protein n=1 Tax=Marinobacter sp. TaxID=50741 RepID=UPI00356ACD4B